MHDTLQIEPVNWFFQICAPHTINRTCKMIFFSRTKNSVVGHVNIWFILLSHISKNASILLCQDRWTCSPVVLFERSFWIHFGLGCVTLLIELLSPSQWSMDDENVLKALRSWKALKPTGLWRWRCLHGIMPIWTGIVSCLTLVSWHTKYIRLSRNNHEEKTDHGIFSNLQYK